MTNRPHLVRPARVALVATLAVGASSALAQVSVDPSTPVSSDAVAPAAPPAPVIVVPDIEPPAAQATPAPIPPASAVEVADTAPEDVAAPAPAASANAPVRAAGPSTEPATPASPSELAEEANVVAGPISPAAPIVQDLPVNAQSAAPSVESAEESEAPGSIVAWAAAMVALVFGAYFIFGRRRKAVRRVVPPVIERPVLEPKQQPAVAEASVRATPVEDARVREPVQFAAHAPVGGGLPHTGAAVALPRTLPDSFEERDALLKRMIAARPDRANPFVSRRARAKRARLILQSLGKDFSDRKPWIDLSQYPNNWPELTRAKSAAA